MEAEERRTVGQLGFWRGGSTPAKSVPVFWAKGTVPWVTPKDMTDARIRTSAELLSDVGASRLSVFDPGNVAVVFRSGILRHTFPVAAADVRFTVNQDLKVLQPAPDVDERFAFHSLQGIARQVVTSAVKSGTTVESVDPTLFFSIPLFVPHPPEQRQIAEILDTLDEAIRKTEQIIAKLQQVKQGLLHDLLTRGIDDNGELRDPDRHPEQFKDSPLGRIPRAWNVQPGSSLFRLAGGGRPIRLRDDDRGKYLYLKVDDFNHPLNEERLVRSSSTFETPMARGMFCPGSVVFPKRGAAIFQNRARILGATGTADPNLMVMIPTGPLRSAFLRDYLLYFNLGTICDNSGIPQINNKHVYPLEFPVPPPEEQDVIEQRINVLAELLNKERTALDKLLSVKSGLMEDLLTGRVRVTKLLEQAAE